MLDQPGWIETVYRRLEEPEATEHHALVRVFQLPGGFRLLVGRDLEERERLFDIIATAGRWSVAIVVVLGLAGGFFVSRRVLKRVDAMTETTQTIMAGDLSGPAADRRHRRRARSARGQSQRHAGADRGADARPQGGVRQHRARSQDAADAAAQSLRGGAAHAPRATADYRAALEATIEESDELIRTFNALLMIARAESGEARDGMSRVRRRRDRARRRRAVRAAGRREGPARCRSRRRRRRRSAATASWSARRLPIWSTMPSNMPRRAASRPTACDPGDPGHGRRGGRPHRAVRVGDRGPGIPEADRARVVERFVRLEQSRSQPGSGLG